MNYSSDVWVARDLMLHVGLDIVRGRRHRCADHADIAVYLFEFPLLLSTHLVCKGAHAINGLLSILVFFFRLVLML